MNTIHIALLNYEGTTATALQGIQDVFQIASQYTSVQFDCRRLNQEDLFVKSESWDVIIIPPAMESHFALMVHPNYVHWIQSQVDNALYVAICAGSLIAGASGLLHQKKITTHESFYEPIIARFPGATLVKGQPWVEDGNLITSGGLMSWLDASLRVVRRYSSDAAYHRVRQSLLGETPTSEFNFTSCFNPIEKHDDDSITRIQQYLHHSLQNMASIPSLAKSAYMSERTFLRRFKTATGYSPSEYMQRYRIHQASIALTESLEPIESIAASVGYEDPSAFRRRFKKLTGLSPSQFRQSHKND